MNNEELYRMIIGGEEPFSYPFKPLPGGDYYDSVLHLCNEFEVALKQLNSESVVEMEKSLEEVDDKMSAPLNLYEDYKKVKGCVEKVIVRLFEGEPAEAFCELEKFLLDYNAHYSNLLPLLPLDEHKVYYRIREGIETDENLPMKQKDLFHIPFEKRHKVASMRYSVPGYPILYVSGSLKMAYQATVKNNNDFTYVKIKGKQTLNFVDMAFPIEDDIQMFEYYCLFIFYPLIVACSMPVLCKKDVYKPEYALPQLLTQYVKKHSAFDGITYVPPQIDDCYKVTELRSHDFAIIVRGGVERSGYDANLASKLQMTRPLVFKECDSLYQHKKNNVPIHLRDMGIPQEIKHWKCRFAYIEDRDKSESFLDIDLS